MKIKIIFALLFVITISLAFNVQTLTEKQKIEDFEYLYKILEKNYPYFGILEREKGIKWLENKDMYLKVIKETKDNKQFIETISKILNDLHNGHTDLNPTFRRKKYLEIYKKHKKYKAWVNELRKGNNCWTELFGKNEDTEYKEEIYYDSTLLNFSILDTNNIAVIKIKSFDHFRIEKDSIKIEAFLNSIKNYNHLIIDIQDNIGGDSKYWSENIVPLLIEKSIIYNNYLAIRNGEYINHFFDKKETLMVKEKYNQLLLNRQFSGITTMLLHNR